MQINNSVLAGTAGGTFISILPHLFSVDVLRTIVLASVGAVVSFVISFLLKCIVRKFRK